MLIRIARELVDMSHWCLKAATLTNFFKVDFLAIHKATCYCTCIYSMYSTTTTTYILPITVNPSLSLSLSPFAQPPVATRPARGAELSAAGTADSSSTLSTRRWPTRPSVVRTRPWVQSEICSGLALEGHTLPHAQIARLPSRWTSSSTAWTTTRPWPRLRPEASSPRTKTARSLAVRIDQACLHATHSNRTGIEQSHLFQLGGKMTAKSKSFTKYMLTKSCFPFMSLLGVHADSLLNCFLCTTRLMSTSNFHSQQPSINAHINNTVKP